MLKPGAGSSVRLTCKDLVRALAPRIQRLAASEKWIEDIEARADRTITLRTVYDDDNERPALLLKYLAR